MMGKKNEYVCDDYADMENAMVRMDELDRRIGREQADAEEFLAKAEAHETKIKALAKERRGIFAAMERYAMRRRGLDFTGDGDSRRERHLKRGIVGFRLAPAAVRAVSRDWTEEKIVGAIEELVKRDAAWKRHAQAQLIRIKKSLNKEAVKATELPAEELAKAGVEIVQEDQFWAQTAYEAEMNEVRRESKGKVA